MKRLLIVATLISFGDVRATIYVGPMNVDGEIANVDGEIAKPENGARSDIRTRSGRDGRCS